MNHPAIGRTEVAGHIAAVLSHPTIDIDGLKPAHLFVGGNEVLREELTYLRTHTERLGIISREAGYRLFKQEELDALLKQLQGPRPAPK